MSFFLLDAFKILSLSLALSSLIMMYLGELFSSSSSFSISFIEFCSVTNLGYLETVQSFWVLLLRIFLGRSRAILSLCLITSH